MKSPLLQRLFWWMLALSSMCFSSDEPWLKVSTPKGEPLASANVEMIPMYEYSRKQAFLTNEKGEVTELREAYEGKDDFLLVRHALFATWGACHVDVSEIKVDEPLLVEMKEGSALSGNIVMENQLVLGKGQVSLAHNVPGNGHTHLCPCFEKTILDEKGSFSFPRVAKGEFKLWMEGDGVVSLHPVKWKHSAKGTLLSLPVVKGEKVLFTFETEDGVSIPHVSFKSTFHQIKTKKWSQLKKKWQKLRWTDEHGKVSMVIPKDGYVSFNIQDDRFEKLDVLNQKLKGAHKTIQLKTKKEWKGIVISEASHLPLEKAQAQLKLKKKGNSYLSTLKKKTTSDGSFSFRIDQQSKAEKVLVWKDGFHAQELDVTKIKDEDVQIELISGERFQFRFLQPIPHSEPALFSGFDITGDWRSKIGATFDVQCRTDADGVAAITGLEQGAEITFEIDGFVDAKVKANSKQIVDVILKQNSIVFVTVKNKKGEALTKNLNFKIKDDYLQDRYDKKKKQHKVSGIAPGTHQLEIRKTGYLSKKVDIQTEVGNPMSMDVILEEEPYLWVELLNGPEPFLDEIDYRLHQHSQRRSHSGTAKQVDTDSKVARYKVSSKNLRDYDKISIQVKGYLPSRHFLDGSLDDPIQVELKKGLSCEGQVRDELGEVVPHAKVVLRKTETSDLTFESDVKGTVQLSGLEAATYDVTIQVESHATLKTNLVVVEDMQNPQWILSRGQSIRAQVLKDGEPQPDVAVMLSKVSEWGYDNEYFDGGSHEEKSDAEGYVTFETLADGKYRCKVRSNDVGIADSKVIVLDDSKNNPVVELHLKEGLSIKGIVVDTEGNPIADQDLNIYAQMTGGEHQNGSSGDDGRFVFQNLKENLNYQLNLNSDAWELTQSGQLHVKAGDQEVKVEVRPMSVLQVHVVDPNGERIDSGATFYMTQEISEQSTKIHNVEWIGKAWEISKRQLNLNVWNMNSRVAIEVHVDGFNPAKSDFMETSKLFDAIMKLELTPQQSVTFRVMNALGLPVEGVELLTQGGMRAKLSAQSNAEGVAVLKGVVAGDLDLTFSKSGYARERAVFSVDPSVPHETEVVLSKGGILMGQVFDRNGDPAVGAKVWITRDDGVQVAEQHTTEGGHYKFTHIKEGEVQLHFSIDSKERFGLPTEGATVEIVNEQETLHDCHEKEIEKAGQLVIVIDEQLSNAYKMVMVTDALGQNMQRQQVTETTIRFEALPEGVVTVVLFGTGGMRNLSAEIKEGEETILEISDDDALKKTAKIVHQDDSPVSMGVAYLLDVNFNATNPMDGMKAMNGMSMIRLGDLEITAQRTGTYRLVVQLHEGESAGQQKDLGEVVIVEGGDPFLGTFKIPEGLEMKLKVLDENGVPLKKVRAMVVKDQMPMTQHTWLSNGDGDLLLKGLSEPPFKLSLNLEGYATLHQDVQHIHDHTLVMTKGFTVTIQLLGENVANRVVSYRLEGASPLMNMFVVGQGLKSDSFGQIKLENLTSGRYILTLGPTASGQDGIESLPFELFEGLDVIEVALP